ncbi:MAG: 3-dehydroquinate synthase II [Thermoplasmata archaeon]|nr:3-dehydroquinate synthase II [Candidatus Sysuiplasma acidicola]MBX8645257.1 3-dehydroquinate synthase II [Candidatus Sysuiplasma acidicola]
MAASKFIWIRADHLHGKERQRFVMDAVELGFTDIVVESGDEALAKGARFHALHISGNELTADGNRIGTFISISSERDMPAESELRPGYLVVDARDWKVIPLENLIALCANRGITLVAVARTKEEALLFLNTLEVGVDGILASVSSRQELSGFAEILSAVTPPCPLESAEILSVRQAGMGDRVCVDTCSMLEEGEGMLVGSQSGVLFLIHSETLKAKYVNARPFRVNAGPVHSYLLLQGGKTGYLSELRAGTEVPAVRIDGRVRNVTVGRVKIERRPLILIEATVRGKECSILLQNAETVNLCTEGEPIPATELKKGDRVLVHVQEGARHFGMSISETIVER